MATTTNTTLFNLDLEEILEQAMDMAGGDLASAADLTKARQALSLLLIDMQNRGHPLANLQNKTLTVASASSAYPLSAGVIDVLSMVVVRSSAATPLARIPLLDYHKIPVKTQRGRPSQFTLDRDRDNAVLYLYPTPENSTDVIDYWCLTQIQDIGTNYTNNIDISTRYLPAVIFGLAYYISLKRRPTTDISMQELVQKRAELKGEYERLLPQAALEDSERVNFTVTPFNYFRRR